MPSENIGMPTLLRRTSRPLWSSPRPRGVCLASYLALVGVSLGCTSEEPPAAHSQATPPSLAEAGPLGLGEVMRRVHFGFRADGETFRGGHTTYAVRATARSFEVAPYGPADGRAGAAFVASLRSIERGGVSVPGARDARADLDAGQRVAITHGDVVEHLENTEQGVEQSFSFATKPAGRGDLEVRIVVSGEAYAGETASGLHFVDPATGLGVVYGVATWVDARGQKTAVPVDFEAGEIVLRVPERALDESVFPAVLDPIIGPEFGIDAPVQVAALGDQTESAVAYGNGNFLVVWRDSRTLGSSDLYGVRVSSAGTILDTSGIPITSADGVQEDPDVAFDGTNWMVSWTDQRSDVYRDIYAARVSGAGAVLDPAGIRISQEIPAVGEGPSALAFDGANYLVAYRRGNGVYGRMIAPSGALFPEFTVASLGVAPTDVDVAWNGSNYLVAFDDVEGSFDTIHGRRVTAAGVVLDATNITLCSGCDPIDLAMSSDGTNWFLVWDDSGIYGQRVTNDGVVLDTPSGKLLASSTSGSRVSVVRAGAGYGVFFDSSGEVYGIRVDSLGNLTLPKTALVGEPGLSSFVAAAHDGTSFLLAFRDTRLMHTTNPPNPADVFGLRVSNALTKIDGSSQLLSRGANAETRPAVAYNGTKYLVVWEDRRPGATTDIYGARLLADGTVLDPSGLAIAEAAASQRVPAVAAAGDKWLVAWTDGRAGNDDVYAARVTDNGLVQDSMGLPVVTGTGNQGTPAVASDGTNWLVTGYDNNTGIWARLVTPDSFTIDGPKIQVSLGAGFSPAVAYNGTNWLIAWMRPTGLNDIVAARLTPAGVVLDAGNLAIDVAAAATVEQAPAVASDGTNWLVTWDTNNDIRGARVNGAGVVLDPMGIGISTATNTQRDARVAWDGAQYWAVWRDDRASFARNDLYGARLTAGGTVLDGTGLVIANEPTQNEEYPSIAAGPYKELLVVYKRFDPAQPYGAERIRARFVTEPGLNVNGASCVIGDQCESGSCVDGVCCDTACDGACVACTADKKGAGGDGECGPVVMGADPDDACAAEDAASCGTTGICNGAGACEFYPQGAACPASCVDGAAQPNACNGMGACAPSEAPTVCAPYACDAGACKTTCATDTDCAAGNVCVNGVCGVLQPNGAACTGTDFCQSGVCEDGVCCDVACAGLCEACTAATKGSGADGVCGPIGSGTDPDDECAPEAAGSCGRNGQCDGAGACQLHAQGTSCGASVCQGTVAKGQICDGMGQCVIDPVGKDCAPHVCSAGSCMNPCTNDNECLAGNICLAGACKPLGMPGLPCVDGLACVSGFCVDGVCCDVACAGACEACSTAKKGQGADGQCGPIVAGVDPDDECAAEPPPTCGFDGQCNGAGSCARHAAGTPCAAGACDGTTQTNPSSCDGSGTCVAGAEVSCVEGYTCVAGACATSCADDTACAPGYTCDVAMKACELVMASGASSSTGSGSSGSAASGSSGAGGSDPAGDGGCGCKVVGASRDVSLAPGVLLAWVLGIALRRRSRGSRAGSKNGGALASS